MMSRKSVSTAAMTVALVSLMAWQPALAYDDVRRLPHPIAPNAPRPTDQSNWQALQQHVTTRFNEASGGAATLTQQQAKSAGWGVVSDNFSKIDTKGAGQVSLAEVLGFLQSRWQQRANANQNKTVVPMSAPALNDSADSAASASSPYNYPPESPVTVTDNNSYDTTANGSLSASAAKEQASLQLHTITINGNSFNFTASAGHLTASKVDPTGKTAPQAEATIFYTAYTRDDLPKWSRPVTFLWNGGPGSSSVWLHMGSFGPQYLDSIAPVVPTSDYNSPPTSFPLKDNPISLLDQTDLVFIDPPGTGFSTAIFPNKNKDFWGTDVDAQVVVDFITRYINNNNRQSSPKFLYGESYGGIRTPIVANLLEQAGTANYQKDPTNKPAQVLNGVILGSPILNYVSSCSENLNNCASTIPNTAMVEDYLNLTSTRGNLTRQAYFNQIYQFINSYDVEVYNSYCNSVIPAITANLNPKTGEGALVPPPQSWTTYINSAPGQRVVKQLQAYAGFQVDWSQASACLQLPGQVGLTYAQQGEDGQSAPLGMYLYSKYKLNGVTGFTEDTYDGRLLVPAKSQIIPIPGLNENYVASNFPDLAYQNGIVGYLASYVSYKNEPKGETGKVPNSDYQELNNDTITDWDFSHDGFSYAESLSDIAGALAAAPNLQFLVMHGWDDFICPETETLWDLEGVNLSSSVPIQNYEGGHMTYQTDATRPQLKSALTSFYNSVLWTQSVATNN
jgi:carboxypeptidase C (cathepsin A)